MGDFNIYFYSVQRVMVLSDSGFPPPHGKEGWIRKTTGRRVRHIRMAEVGSAIILRVLFQHKIEIDTK